MISGNNDYGVRVTGATSVTIAGNFIGVDKEGDDALGNTIGGVLVQTAGNTIGGATTSYRNVIAGGGDFGIRIDGVSATGNTIQNNYIGLNAAGTAAVGAFADSAVWLNGADVAFVIPILYTLTLSGELVTL